MINQYQECCISPNNVQFVYKDMHMFSAIRKRSICVFSNVQCVQRGQQYVKLHAGPLNLGVLQPLNQGFSFEHFVGGVVICGLQIC